MSVHHSHVSTVVAAQTWSMATDVPVHQRTLVAPAPRRTASVTTRVVMAGRVMVPGCVAVLPDLQVLIAPSTCVITSHVTMEDRVSVAPASVLSASPGQPAKSSSAT